jgi:hypothetical protein
MQVLLEMERWPLVAAVRTSTILYPLINALHILGLAVLVGAIVTLDMRVLGIWKPDRWQVAVSELSPVAATGLVVTLLTGAILFSVRASRYVENPALVLKLALIALALINVLVFHRALGKSSGPEPSLLLRLCAAISSTAWIGCVFAGRWIAYST